MNDYALIRQNFDIPLPTTNANALDIEDYLLALIGDCDPSSEDGRSVAFGPLISGYFDFRCTAASAADMARNKRQIMGFDLREVDQSVLTYPSFMGNYQIARGRFDPQATDQALLGCTDCPEFLRSEYQGVSYYDWSEYDSGTNIGDRFAFPFVDLFGNAGQFAVQDEYVFRTDSPQKMQQLIDASVSKSPSLADDDEYQSLATEMTTLGAYSVYLSNFTHELDQFVELGWAGTRDDSTKQAILEKGGLLRPYQAFATGRGEDDEGPYMVIVLVHSNPTLATENAELLKNRIEDDDGELYKVDQMVINTKGNILIAELRGPIAFQWIYWSTFQYDDPLLLHE